MKPCSRPRAARRPDVVPRIRDDKRPVVCSDVHVLTPLLYFGKQGQGRPCRARRGCNEALKRSASDLPNLSRGCGAATKLIIPIRRGTSSDEEGPATDAIQRVIEVLGARGDRIDWCLIGEPTSEERLGDAIKVGRHGSLSATLRVAGTQGHVAYPERVANPIHLASPALHALCTTRWGQGNACFPPTSLQITEVRARVGADNIVPGETHGPVQPALFDGLEPSGSEAGDHVEELLGGRPVIFGRRRPGPPSPRAIKMRLSQPVDEILMRFASLNEKRSAVPDGRATAIHGVGCSACIGSVATPLSSLWSVTVGRTEWEEWTIWPRLVHCPCKGRPCEQPSPIGMDL